MLRNFTLALAATLLLALAPGCDNSSTDDDDDNLDCRPGTFTATADGSAFNPACIVLSMEGGVIAITAITNLTGAAGSMQRQINVNIIGQATGTYNPPFQASLSYAFGDSPTALKTTAATSGQVVVDEVSATRVRGTFQFSGPEFDAAGQPTNRTVTVSNGQFNVER